MCCWAKVSRSGYYKWRNRLPSQRTQQRECIRKAIIETFSRFKKRYGAPRIATELTELGLPCSVNHVATLMSEEGLKARNGKRFRYQVSNNMFTHVSPNRLARNFTANQPNEKWVSDITYIKVNRGHVYLAVIMDLFSRRIIGWAMDDHMGTDLVVEAFDMAVETRQITPGLILHSDRGVQYRSSEYQGNLNDVGITPSMSRTGNCWDNAAMESFFSRLKVESIHAQVFTNLEEAYAEVFEYIEMFYNSVRRHTSIGSISPNQFEQNYYEQCA